MQRNNDDDVVEKFLSFSRGKCWANVEAIWDDHAKRQILLANEKYALDVGHQMILGYRTLGNNKRFARYLSYQSDMDFLKELKKRYTSKLGKQHYEAAKPRYILDSIDARILELSTPANKKRPVPGQTTVENGPRLFDQKKGRTEPDVEPTAVPNAQTNDSNQILHDIDDILDSGIAPSKPL